MEVKKDGELYIIDFDLAACFSSEELCYFQSIIHFKSQQEILLGVERKGAHITLTIQTRVWLLPRMASFFPMALQKGQIKLYQAWKSNPVSIPSYGTV